MMPKSFKLEVSLALQLSVSADGKSLALFETRAGSILYPIGADSSLDILEVKEYDIHESWTKMIRLCPHGPHRNFLPKALYLRKSGEVVMAEAAERADEASCPRHYSCSRSGYELFFIEFVSQQFKSLDLDTGITLSILVKRAVSYSARRMQFLTEGKKRFAVQ